MPINCSLNLWVLYLLLNLQNQHEGHTSPKISSQIKKVYEIISGTVHLNLARIKNKLRINPKVGCRKYKIDFNPIIRLKFKCPQRPLIIQSNTQDILVTGLFQIL